MEKGWTIIMFSFAVLVILLGLLPMRLSHSSFSIFVSLFFAALPSAVVLGIFINDHFPSFKKEQTMAEVYYKDKTQRSIASAIEKNDTVALKELIKGQDLNIQGNKVWDWPGLNYLQFAIRLRNNNNIMLNEKANLAAISLLINEGSATTPALSEGISSLPPQTFALLLDNGADLKTRDDAYGEPLLFKAIGTDKNQNDNAILLIQKGADVNAKNSDSLTLIMFTAQNAGTSPEWNDAWRIVRFLLEDAHADFTYAKDNISDIKTFGSIIRGISVNAAEGKVTMCPDFLAIVAWLKKHNVETEI